MCRAKECLSICGEIAIFARFALFSPRVLARTAATRALAASNTFSHDSYAIGIPDSPSHSHSGSNLSSPSANSRIRSSGLIARRCAPPVRFGVEYAGRAPVRETGQMS
jgi:hypothetical protein